VNFEATKERSDSKTLFNELKLLRYQNEELQEKLSRVTERLELIAVDESDSKSSPQSADLTELMASILKAQQEREEALKERFEAANSDREVAVRQLTELVDVLLQPNELLDGSGGHGSIDSEGSEPEEDEQAYEFELAGSSGQRRRQDDDVDKLREKVAFTRMQLKHEIKLRLIQEKKSRRLERVVNGLHEKVASFHF
jgi:DNA-directed RNA polymerase specialized sigma54-like protein